MGKNTDKRSEEVSVKITWEELDNVARKVGLDNGEVLYMMLNQPSASRGNEDYKECVRYCQDRGLEGGALTECIKGCAIVNSPKKESVEEYETRL